MALADREPAVVIGEQGALRDKPGFEVHFVTRGSAPSEMHAHDHPTVLMPMRGHWRVSVDGREEVLAPRRHDVGARGDAPRARTVDDGRGEPLPRRRHRGEGRSDLEGLRRGERRGRRRLRGGVGRATPSRFREAAQRIPPCPSASPTSVPCRAARTSST